MRTLGKIMLLAVLALPMGSVFAANSSLQVNVTVTIASSIDIQFGAGGTTRTFTVAGGALGTVYRSDNNPATAVPVVVTGGDGSLDITNNSTTPINITATAGAFVGWNKAAAYATRDDVVATIEPGTNGTSAGAVNLFAGGTLFSELLDGVNTAGLAVTVRTPTKVTSVTAAKTFTITLSASAN